jgi:multiple sugar transport system permease protein
MSSWKTWMALAMFILLAVALYPRPEKDDPEKNKGVTTITLWGTLIVTEETATAVDEFERENPQYKVQIGASDARDSIADPTRFLLSVAGEDPPDVCGFNRLGIIELAARGAFVDLTPYIEADKGRPDGLHEEDFFKSMWDETCYKGRQYAISYGANARALILNDDLLLRAGFRNEDGSVRPPKSWEDICRKKFHGSGTVTSDGVVRLGSPTELPGVGPFPVSGGAAVADDVVVLTAGRSFFRARIKSVGADGALQIDFSRELATGTKAVPAALVNAGNLEVKVFDKNSYTIAMTRFKPNGDIDVLGFTPFGGNSWPLNFGWQNEATFMADNGERVFFDDPNLKVAYQYLVDIYDCVGGLERAKPFEDPLMGDRHSPFVRDKLAMIINGSWFLGAIASYRADFQFTVVPAPLPEARIKEGKQPFTWIGGGAWAIPKTAKHPEAGWALMRFMASDKARKLMYEVNASRLRASGMVYVPDMPFRRDHVPYVRAEYLANNPGISTRVIEAYDVMAGLLPNARFRVPTPISNRLYEAQHRAAADAMAHRASVHDALISKTPFLQEGLDKFFEKERGARIDWSWMIGGYILLLAIGAAFLARSEMRRRRAGFGRRDWKAGYMSVSPWLVGFIVFGGGPILFSLVISFCHYDALTPARFIGLDNYIKLLGFHKDSLTGAMVANDPKFWKSLANTAFMLVALPISISLGLLLAVLLNNQFRGIAAFRTLFYMPSILPTVATFLLWVWVFDPHRGLLNNVLMEVGVTHPPKWLHSATWAKPALILMGLWGIGGGMLIWLAGLKAIPVQLYEAAEIDGAGPMRRFFRITLPMLSPYIFFNTVMGIIGTLQVFEAAYIMTNGEPEDSTLFYAFYLFHQAFRYLDMGTASAMAWILFALVLALTLFQLKVSRKWVHYD